MEKKQTAVEWLDSQLDFLHKYMSERDRINLFEQAKEMEKQQIIDVYNQEICLHLDKEFVSGVFGGYWCPKCNRNVDSELEQD